jgi:predicted protein tyrosine phosphatase
MSAALNGVTASLQSFDLLTLLSPDYPHVDWREFACERHLRLAFHDIVEPTPGLTAPDRDLMRRFSISAATPDINARC